MLRFAQTCEAIAATTRKLEKTALVADYLRSLPPEPGRHCRDFSFRTPVRRLQRNHSTGRRIASLAHDRGTVRKVGAELTEIYRRHGDAGSVAAEALPPKSDGLSLPRLTCSGLRSDRRRPWPGREGPSLAGNCWSKPTPLEAKYIVKIISGDLRIGLKESLVEEAIAKAFDSARSTEVKRANMLLGDIGETLRLADCRQTRRSPDCACSIPSISCWPARSSPRKKR